MKKFKSVLLKIKEVFKESLDSKIEVKNFDEVYSSQKFYIV